MDRRLLLAVFAALCACRSPGGLRGKAALGETVLVAAPDEAPEEDSFTPSLPTKHSVESIAVGPNHGCAVGSNGALACWGSNERREVGHRFGSGWCEPRTVLGVRDVTAVAIGPRYTCTVQAEVTVACWGDHPAARIDPESFPASHRFDVETPIAQIATAPTYACARNRKGAVSCWGSAAKGQLGDPSASDTTAATPLELNPAISLSIADGLGCIVDTEGQLICWGQLGALLVDRPPPDAVFPPTEIPAPAVESVALAGSAPCVIDDQGQLQCWLQRTAGPTTVVSHPVPIGIERIERVLGLTHDGSGCATRRDEDGRMETACWRGSSLRDYGWPEYPGSPHTANIANLSLATAPTPNGMVGCGATPSGNVECWTANNEVLELPPLDFKRPHRDAPPACSNRDLDADGIVDVDDQCPSEPETFNRRADGDGCPDEGESKVVIDNRSSRVSLLEDVAFTSPRVRIQARSLVAVDHLASALNAHQEFEHLEIRVGSHGRSSYRASTARRRAAAIRDALIDRGVEPERLSVRTEPLPRGAPSFELEVTRYRLSGPR